MFGTFLNIFKVPELRNKILFTISMLAAYRIGFCVPVPGVDQAAMTGSGGPGSGGPLGDLMDYFQLFTGGNLRQSTIFGLGIMPYISASIIFQLLVTVVPSLEKLSQEGETGRRKIQEYTRYATVCRRCAASAASASRPRWSYRRRRSWPPQSDRFPWKNGLPSGCWGYRAKTATCSRQRSPASKSQAAEVTPHMPGRACASARPLRG